MRKLKKGFTIVELVIVIAVVAVLTAVLVPTFIHLTKKAKDASDKTVVKNANIQLAAKEATEGKNKSMHDAVLDVKEIGYHIPTVQTGNENKILWDKNNDRFVLVDKDDKVLHSDAGVAVGDKIEGDAKLNYFYAVDALGKRDGYSVYALGKSILDATGESPVVNIAGFGFDAGDIGESAGETEDDKKFTINVADSNKSILVATNSVSTSVHVDAKDGTVTHAGIAGKEQIVEINSSSFHETGKVGFIEMGKGNFVAESSAEIKALWFNDKTATYDKKSGAVVTEYADSEEVKAGVGLDSGTAVREEIIVSDNKGQVEEDAVEELDHEINPQPTPSDPYAALVAQIESDPLAATAVYASVREGTTTYCFDSIPEAVADARLFIIMLNNDSTSFASFWDGANVVMDLNGHNVTLTGDGLGIVDGAVLTLKDSKGAGSLRTPEIALFGTGTLYIESGDYTFTGDGIWGFGGIVRITGGSFNIGINSGWYDSSLYKVENINGRNYVLPL